jgi:hypothetical protein
MTPQQILSWAKSSGITVTIGPGGYLHAAPAAKVRGTLKAAIAGAKADIIAILAAAESPTPPPAEPVPAGWCQRCRVAPWRFLTPGGPSCECDDAPVWEGDAADVAERESLRTA